MDAVGKGAILAGGAATTIGLGIVGGEVDNKGVEAAATVGALLAGIGTLAYAHSGGLSADRTQSSSEHAPPVIPEPKHELPPAYEPFEAPAAHHVIFEHPDGDHSLGTATGPGDHEAAMKGEHHVDVHHETFIR